MFTLRDPDHPEAITCLAWSPQGNTLASGNSVGRLAFWDLEQRRVRLNFRLPGAREGFWAEHTSSVAYAPDGARLVVTTGTFPPYVRVYQADTDHLLLQVEGGWSANAAVFLSDDSVISAGGIGYGAHDGGYPIYRWNPATRRRRKVMAGHAADIYTLAVSPDDRLLATGGADKTARLWDVEKGVEGHILNLRSRVREVGFAPDGRTLAVASARVISLWETDTGKRIRRLRGHGETVHSIAFHPTGRWLASASEDGTARFWEVSTGQVCAAFDWQVGPARTIRFAPDGLTAALGSKDGSLVVWDVDLS
jgi:WD40 repeat protein